MSTPYGAIGSNSGYIPTATEGLVIGYSRDYTKYKLGRYCAMKPVTRRVGFYQRFNPAVQARTGAVPLNDARWAPGSQRPNGLKNQTEMEFVKYETERFDEAVNSEYTAMEQANWAVEDLNAQTVANLCMIRRTQMAEVALATMLPQRSVSSAKGPTSVYSQVFGPAATGNLASATSTNPAILGVLLWGARQVYLASYGSVQNYDLCIKLNPNTASAIAILPEIQNAFIQSNYSKGVITGDDTSADSPIAAFNAIWGLPVMLRGFPIVIEDAIADPGKPGDDPNPGYVMPDACIDILATPGNIKGRILPPDIQSEIGERYFPVTWTLAEFCYQDMMAESFPDVRSRMTDSHISYDLQYQVVSTVGGMRLVDLFD